MSGSTVKRPLSAPLSSSRRYAWNDRNLIGGSRLLSSTGSHGSSGVQCVHMRPLPCRHHTGSRSRCTSPSCAYRSTSIAASCRGLAASPPSLLLAPLLLANFAVSSVPLVMPTSANGLYAAAGPISDLSCRRQKLSVMPSTLATLHSTRCTQTQRL